MFIKLFLLQRKLKKYCNRLSKQQALDPDSKLNQNNNFIEDLNRARDTRMFFIPEEPKDTVMDFSQGTARVNSHSRVA